jgi:hypothetical protein
MTDEKKPAELWAIVECMGHTAYAGRLSEYSELGVPLVRVEIPAVNDQPACEKLLGAASIFRITPCTEEAARLAAAQFQVRPLELVSLPHVEPARIEGYGDFFDDNGDEET